MYMKARALNNFFKCLNKNVINNNYNSFQYHQISGLGKRIPKNHMGILALSNQNLNKFQSRLTGGSLQPYSQMTVDENDLNINQIDKNLKFEIDHLSLEQKKKFLGLISIQNKRNKLKSIYDFFNQSTSIINQNNIYHIMVNMKERLINAHISPKVVESKELQFLYSKIKSLFIQSTVSDLIICLDVFSRISLNHDYTPTREILQMLKLRSSELSAEQIINLNGFFKSKNNRSFQEFVYLLPILMEKHINEDSLQNLKDKELIELFLYCLKSNMKNCDLVMEEIFQRGIDIMDLSDLLNILWNCRIFPNYPINRLMFPSSFDIVEDRLKRELYIAIAKNIDVFTESQMMSLIHILFSANKYSELVFAGESLISSMSEKSLESNFSNIILTNLCSLQYRMKYVNKTLLGTVVDNLQPNSDFTPSIFLNLHRAAATSYHNTGISEVQRDRLIQCASKQLYSGVTYQLLNLSLDLIQMDIYDKTILEKVLTPSFIKRYKSYSAQIGDSRQSSMVLLYFIVSKSENYNYLIKDLPLELALQCFHNYHEAISNQLVYTNLKCYQILDELLPNKVLPASVMYKNSLLIDRLLVVDENSNIKNISTKKIKNNLNFFNYSDLDIDEKSDKKIAIMDVDYRYVCQPHNMLKPAMSLKMRCLEEEGFNVIIIFSGNSVKEQTNHLRKQLSLAGVNMDSL